MKITLRRAIQREIFPSVFGIAVGDLDFHPGHSQLRTPLRLRQLLSLKMLLTQNPRYGVYGSPEPNKGA